MVIHSSILAWRIPWTEEPGGLQSLGLQGVRHDWATNIFTFTWWIWGQLSWNLLNSIIWLLSPWISCSKWLLFHRYIVSDSLQSNELQHAKLPLSFTSPRACSDSCPLSQWCYLTISSCSKWGLENGVNLKARETTLNTLYELYFHRWILNTLCELFFNIDGKINKQINLYLSQVWTTTKKNPKH